MKMAKAMRAVTGGVLVAFSVLAGDATAQPEQTAEGAQKFLGTVFGNGGSSLDFDSGRGWNRTDPESCRRWFIGDNSVSQTCLELDRSDYWIDVGPVPIAWARADGVCKTTLMSGPKPARERKLKRRWDVGTAEYLLVSGTNFGAFEVDWTKVAGTSHTGKIVSLAGISPKIGVNLPSEEMAARVAYAMEFLRLHCDKAAGTGF